VDAVDGLSQAGAVCVTPAHRVAQRLIPRSGPRPNPRFSNRLGFGRGDAGAVGK